MHATNGKGNAKLLTLLINATVCILWVYKDVCSIIRLVLSTISRAVQTKQRLHLFVYFPLPPEFPPNHIVSYHKQKQKQTQKKARIYAHNKKKWKKKIEKIANVSEHNQKEKEKSKNKQRAKFPEISTV